MHIVFWVSKKDIENYQTWEEQVRDYPLYGHTDGLGKTEIVLVGKILQWELSNEEELEVHSCTPGE
jgi:hypothetical protein